MKFKYRIIFLISALLFVCGCDGFRIASTDSQKLNAWLHYRTAAVASELAVGQQSSEALCKLTNLSAAQSGAFLVDYGLPKPLPQLDSSDDILVQQNYDAAWQIAEDAASTPTGWDIADNAMEIGLALAGLVGGAYGLKFTNFLKTAQQKSTALREIVTGNELFKQQHSDLSETFKSAQQLQSADTKQIVTQIKNNS